MSLNCELDGQDSEHLKALKLLTQVIINEFGHGITMYDGGVGRGLYHDDELAVQLVYMKAGDNFPIHAHNSTEFMIVVHGKIDITFENGRIESLSPCDVIILEPGQSHGATILEDCLTVAVTIPADEGYPKVICPMGGDACKRR